MINPASVNVPCQLAFRRNDGSLLLKRYDTSYRRITAGRWIVFDPLGTCAGYSFFFNERQNNPPFSWADQKLEDRIFLTRHGF